MSIFIEVSKDIMHVRKRKRNKLLYHHRIISMDSTLINHKPLVSQCTRNCSVMLNLKNQSWRPINYNISLIFLYYNLVVYMERKGLVFFGYLPRGDQARHREPLLLLDFRYKVFPRALRECSTKNIAKVSSKYITVSLKCVFFFNPEFVVLLYCCKTYHHTIL